MSERAWRIWTVVEEIDAEKHEWIYRDLGFWGDRNKPSGADDGVFSRYIEFLYDEIKRMVPYLNASFVVPWKSGMRILSHYNKLSNTIIITYYKNQNDAVETFFQEVFHCAHKCLPIDEQLHDLQEMSWPEVRFNYGCLGGYLEVREERAAHFFLNSQ